MAERLRQLRADATVCFVGTERSIDRDIISTTPFELISQPIRPLPSRPWEVPAFLLSWRRSSRLARQLLDRHAPAAVLGLGAAGL